MLHFAVIGALLFFGYEQMNPSPGSSERIVVTRALVDDLARQHQQRWSRPPTEPELAGLVDAYVRDEILYREGVSKRPKIRLWPVAAHVSTLPLGNRMHARRAPLAGRLEHAAHLVELGEQRVASSVGRICFSIR
jgi:hypothetical protein